MYHFKNSLFGIVIVALLSFTACQDLTSVEHSGEKSQEIEKSVYGHSQNAHGGGLNNPFLGNRRDIVQADIVFSRGSLNGAELFAMNSDGTGLVQLTNNNFRDVEPVWGPRGQIVVFERGLGSIYKLDTRRGGTISEVIDTGNRDAFPDVSPDGNKVVFASFLGSSLTGPGFEIFTANMDGTGLTRLTNANGSERDPHWSPDGSKIVFVSERDEPDPINPNQEIYVMNADGSGQTRLTFSGGGSSPTPRQDIDPHWSPDGTRIAFSSNRDLNPEIYIMNADGSGVTQITFTDGLINSDPTWSPDGSQITFSQGAPGSGGDDLFIVNTDGTGLTRITADATLTDRQPDWKNLPGRGR